MGSHHLPPYGDYSRYSSYWRKQIDIVATILSALGEDVALDFLLEAKLILGEWTPELNALGLRILKPNAPWGEESSS